MEHKNSKNKSNIAYLWQKDDKKRGTAADAVVPYKQNKLFARFRFAAYLAGACPVLLAGSRALTVDTPPHGVSLT